MNPNCKQAKRKIIFIRKGTVMNKLVKEVSIAVVACLILFSSCSSTKTLDTWKDSTYKGRYIEKVLVAGISFPFDSRQLEDTFIARFQEYGIQAVSLKAISPDMKYTVDSMRAEAQRIKSDSVLTIRMIGMKEKEEWERFVPTPEFTGPLYMESMQYPPLDYEFEKEDLVIESSLYDTVSGKLIWRLHSETIKRGSIGKENILNSRLVASLSKKVMEKLRNSGLIR
jgi:hypothetical protein